MARLSELKIAMGTSIFIASFIFGLFIFAILFLLQLDLTSGLIFALLATGIFVLLQYLIGPIIVSATTHLQYVQPGKNPWLEYTVKELSEKSGLPMPKLAIVPNNTPNAFTYGRTAKSATLAVHEGLLRNLNKDEVKGVIAHELGHIKHKDYIVITVLAALPMIAYIVAQVAFRAGIFSGYSRKGRDKDNSGIILLVIGILSFVIYIISFLSVMRLSRLREHYADSYSAYLTGTPRNLESALSKITYGLSIAPNATAEARTFYIEDPAMAKQEIHMIMEKKQEYDLDNDGVLDQRELEHAMEREAKSTWNQLNSLFATQTRAQTGKYTNDRIYEHV